MFTKEMLKKYANDLLFDLSEEEYELLLSEFDVIKENMDIIASFPNISEVEPMSFPQEIKIDSLRDDDLSSNLEVDDVLKNADDVIEDVIIVPKVVG